MQSEILLNYDILKTKLEAKENEVLEGLSSDVVELDAYNYLGLVLYKKLLDLRTPYTDKVYLYGNHPIKVGDLTNFVADIKLDLDILYSSYNKLNSAASQVAEVTDSRYFYRGAKYLDTLFKPNYLAAKYGQKLLQFENFQNVEKNKFDEVFFVDRALGFVTKNVKQLEYFNPTITRNTSPISVIFDSFYPQTSTLKHELLLDLGSSQIINMLYCDLGFPGDQFLDSIDYILYSIDGVNYSTVDPYLVNYINSCFTSIYDQNFFTGFIPLETIQARYIKLGISKKLPAPDVVYNKVYAVRATYTDSYEKATIPIFWNMPYVANSTVNATAYVPADFNYVNNYIMFEEDSSITYNFEMSVNKDVLNKYQNSFYRNNYKYTSPIVFDYSVFVGL